MKKNFFGALVILVLILFPNKIKAQENFNVTAGIGLPEMLNLGLRMQFEQTQWGIAVGTAPGSREKNIALSTDFYYHFGGSSEYTTLRPWFLKTGLTYLRSESEWVRSTTFMVVPRAGREFNISPKFGIALEAGFLIILYDHEKTIKENPNDWFDLDLNFAGVIIPSAAVNFYYRF